MTTLATSDLGWDAIQAILGDTGDASLQELCMHANVEPLGLDPTYCPGDGVTARYNNLRTAPYNMGYFRGYMAPNWYAFGLDICDDTVYRCVMGETLHSSKVWDGGFQYYTGSVFAEQLYNLTALICNTPSVGDIAKNLGATNEYLVRYTAGSPGWHKRFEDENWPILNAGDTASLPAGNYYWCWRMGVRFFSDDFGDEDWFSAMTIADYLLSDPDEFNDFPAGGGSDHFHVWTGLYSNSVAISGGVYLTGATNGTGNRQQNFTIPNNTTGYPITHHILTTAAGMTSSHVYIYQLA